MKKTKLLVIVLVISVLLFQSFVPVYATTSEQRLSTIERFALATVQKVSLNDPSSTWNDNTVISDSIPLYDINGNLNGYIYNLTTNGTASGYIHIFTYNDNYSAIAYTFEGRHYVEGLIQQNITSKKIQRANNRIVYVGNIDYYIITSEDVLCNVSNSEILINSKSSSLQSQYERIRANIMNEAIHKDYFIENGLSQDSRSVVKKYVLNANNLDIVSSVPYTNNPNYKLYGSTVSGICAPVAGTTLVKYWANRRGVSGLYYKNDWWVISSLCVNMKTDYVGGIGTSSNNIYKGLMQYSLNTRGIQYSGADFWGNSLLETVNFSKAKEYIDVDVPFMIGLRMTDSTGDTVGHEVACFGYYISNGVNQLIFATGWDYIWTFQSYATLDTIHYQYVRWN